MRVNNRMRSHRLFRAFKIVRALLLEIFFEVGSSEKIFHVSPKESVDRSALGWYDGALIANDFSQPDSASQMSI